MPRGGRGQSTEYVGLKPTYSIGPRRRRKAEKLFYSRVSFRASLYLTYRGKTFDQFCFLDFFLHCVGASYFACTFFSPCFQGSLGRIPCHCCTEPECCQVKKEHRGTERISTEREMEAKFGVWEGGKGKAVEWVCGREGKESQQRVRRRGHKKVWLAWRTETRLSRHPPTKSRLFEKRGRGPRLNG